MQLRHAHIPDPMDDRPTPAETLLEMIDVRPAWHAKAACRGKGDVMFPGRGGSFVPAILLCERCPVKAECMHAGRRESDGVWGGEIKDRQTKRKHVSTSVQSAVLAWFKANPGWHTMAEIRAGIRTDKHERTVQNAVRILADAGLVEISGKGRRRGAMPPTYKVIEELS